MACGDVGGRVTDCAGSSVAVEWSDPEGDDGAPIPARRLRLNLRNWVAVATANGQACAEWATRGDERRNTAAYGHAISLGAFRTVLGVGVDEAGSISWRSCTRRLVDLAARRLVGPSAHRPSGRGPGCGFASDHAIPTPNPAGGGFGLGSGSHVWFCWTLRQREIKFRRHQGPTSGGVFNATVTLASAREWNACMHTFHPLAC